MLFHRLQPFISEHSGSVFYLFTSLQSIKRILGLCLPSLHNHTFPRVFTDSHNYTSCLFFRRTRPGGIAVITGNIHCRISVQVAARYVPRRPFVIALRADHGGVVPAQRQRQAICARP